MRTTLRWATIVVALGSLAVYAELVEVKPRAASRAFTFVIVPPVSLVLSALGVGLAGLLQRRAAR